MATLSLKGVRKTYPNGFQAVHGIDAEIADGEFVVIVGPSGCGKSTLLRMIAGLEEISEGELQIDGERMNNLEPKERDIAMVFQNYALYPHMTVFGNMAYGLKNRGDNKAEIDRKVREAAEILELGALLERKPSQLSGGQRQRVAMGRAIVRQPKVFLFDEPLSNLDAKLRVQMRIEIKKLQRDLGVTAVYVTHDQVEAMTLADRLIAMNGGRAEQIGAPLDLYHRPDSLFVAEFIGSPPMNILPPDALPATFENAHRIGVRPEDIELRHPGGGTLEGVVELREALGAETLIHASLPDGARIVIRTSAGDLPAEGETIGLAVPQEKVTAFDPDGRRYTI